MQKTQDGGANRTEPTTTLTPTWLGQGPGEIAHWMRADWAEPIGYFLKRTLLNRTAKTSHGDLKWSRVAIPTLYLNHRAAISLIQGMDLSRLLLERHYFLFPTGQHEYYCSSGILVNSSPWRPYKLPLVLDDIIFTFITEKPEGLSDYAALDFLISDRFKP